MAERQVQNIKKILSALKSNEGPYLALIQYRTSPVDNNIASAAKIIFSRKILNIIPTSDLYFETKNLNHSEIKNLPKVRQE